MKFPRFLTLKPQNLISKLGSSSASTQNMIPCILRLSLHCFLTPNGWLQGSIARFQLPLSSHHIFARCRNSQNHPSSTFPSIPAGKKQEKWFSHLHNQAFEGLLAKHFIMAPELSYIRMFVPKKSDFYIIMPH